MKESPEPAKSKPEPVPRRRSWTRWGLTRLLPGIILLWVVGDLVYSRVILYRLDRWEATIPRGTNGVWTGHDTFEVGSGSTALLLVHGINISPYVYQQIAPEWAKRGLHCRAIRLPGFATPIREYGQATAEQWVDAVDQELRALRSEHKTVIVVAHSLGAAVTLNALLERNPPVDGVVLLAPAVEVSNARSPLLPTRFWHEFTRWTLYFTRYVESPFTYDLRDPEVMETFPQQPFTPRNIVDQTFHLVDANRGRAAELQLPMLMIVAQVDRIIDTPAAKKFFTQWGGDQKELIEQEKSGHMLTIDYQWREVMTAVADFAEKISQDQPKKSPLP